MVDVLHNRFDRADGLHFDNRYRYNMEAVADSNLVEAAEGNRC